MFSSRRFPKEWLAGWMRQTVRPHPPESNRARSRSRGNLSSGRRIVRACAPSCCWSSWSRARAQASRRAIPPRSRGRQEARSRAPPRLGLVVAHRFRRVARRRAAPRARAPEGIPRAARRPAGSRPRAAGPRGLGGSRPGDSRRVGSRPAAGPRPEAPRRGARSAVARPRVASLPGDDSPAGARTCRTAAGRTSMSTPTLSTVASAIECARKHTSALAATVYAQLTMRFAERCAWT